MPFRIKGSKHATPEGKSSHRPIRKSLFLACTYLGSICYNTPCNVLLSVKQSYAVFVVLPTLGDMSYYCAACID